MKKLAAVALALCCLASPGNAKPDNYHVRGSGALQCSLWTAQKDLAIGQLHKQWILGYVTAVNYGLQRDENIAPGLKNAGLLAWVDDYCSKHPIEDITDAAATLIYELLTRGGAR
jgi:hypothetical protein